MESRNDACFPDFGLAGLTTFLFASSTWAQSVDTYTASADFSNVQGYRNWYYLDSTGAQMYFNGWAWQGPETYLLLWSNGGHPGNYNDAVRQWRAPSSGSVHVTGSVSDANVSCGTGVIVSIKNGSRILWQQTIDNGNTVGFSYDLTVAVNAGDQLNFVINNRGDWGCDSTNFDPTIAFTNGGDGVLAAPRNTPFGGTRISIPGTIEGENFDNGGGDVGYHDTSAGTHGQDYDNPPNYPPPAYRQPTDVDIYKSAGGYSNGHLVMMQAGDWMNYSVNITEARLYSLDARVAWGGGATGNFHIRSA
jgi:carbohydrate binding protein with CBM6 domain